MKGTWNEEADTENDAYFVHRLRYRCQKNRIENIRIASSNHATHPAQKSTILIEKKDKTLLNQITMTWLSLLLPIPRSIPERIHLITTVNSPDLHQDPFFNPYVQCHSNSHHAKCTNRTAENPCVIHASLPSPSSLNLPSRLLASGTSLHAVS